MPGHAAHSDRRENLPPPSLAILAAIGATSGSAHLGINFTPYLVGGLIDKYGYSPVEMGTFSTAETLAFAAAMFIAAPRAHVLSARGVALAASALVVAAQIGSAAIVSFPLLLVGRLATGFGFGLLNTAVNVAAGRTGHPERAISAAIGLQVILFAAMNIALPMIGQWGGVSAMFLSLAAVSLVLAAGMLPLPAGSGRAGAAHPEAEAIPIAAGGGAVLAAMGLFAFGTMAIWPFMERAGHAIGLPATEFGKFQSMATLLCAAGNFTLTVMLARRARPGLLEAMLFVCGLSCAVLTSVGSIAIFAIALQLYNVSWYLVYPLLLGLAYKIDPQGRLAVRTTATWLVAQSVGSFAAGVIAQVTSGYRVVGLLGFASCVLAIVVVIVHGARTRRSIAADNALPAQSG